MRLLTFLIIGLIFPSCGEESGPEKVVQSTTAVAKNPTEQADVDPYFTGTSIITSKYGPQNITRNALLDNKGNIWLATWEGIMQYNPQSEIFTNYTNRDSLRRYRAFSILEDRKGDIWFGTIGAGVYRYDGSSFTNITTKDGLVNDRATCFMEDRSGNIWIGTTDGLSKYNGSTFTNYLTGHGLTSADVNSIVEDRSGKIWFGTRGTACVFDGFTFTEIKNDQGAPFTNVRTIIESSNGDIWLGGNDGLWRYNGKSYTQIAENFTGYISEDSDMNIWTSSESSDDRQSWVLSRYDRSTIDRGGDAVGQIKRIDGMFFGILVDYESQVWIGALDGIYRYDGLSFERFKYAGLGMDQ